MFPTIKLNIERWKYNPTFELYVSNMGHIRNKSKADIAPKIMQNGYVVVYVYGSLNKYVLLHRVVMLTWKPTPEAEELTVDHLDHNKRNNALSNLEWVTQEENTRRAKEDYIVGSTLVGNDVIITKTKNEQKKAAAARDKTIKYFYISRKHNTKPPFTIRADMSDFDKKANSLLGTINNFTVEGFREILQDMLIGKNTAGAKKWCGMTVRAACPDNAFYNGTGPCPMQMD